MNGESVKKSFFLASFLAYIVENVSQEKFAFMACILVGKALDGKLKQGEKDWSIWRLLDAIS